MPTLGIGVCGSRIDNDYCHGLLEDPARSRSTFTLSTTDVDRNSNTTSVDTATFSTSSIRGGGIYWAPPSRRLRSIVPLTTSWMSLPLPLALVASPSQSSARRNRHHDDDDYHSDLPILPSLDDDDDDHNGASMVTELNASTNVNDNDVDSDTAGVVQFEDAVVVDVDDEYDNNSVDVDLPQARVLQVYDDDNHVWYEASEFILMPTTPLRSRDGGSGTMPCTSPSAAAAAAATRTRTRTISSPQQQPQQILTSVRRNLSPVFEIIAAAVAIYNINNTYTKEDDHDVNVNIISKNEDWNDNL